MRNEHLIDIEMYANNLLDYDAELGLDAHDQRTIERIAADLKRMVEGLSEELAEAVANHDPANGINTAHLRDFSESWP